MSDESRNSNSNISFTGPIHVIIDNNNDDNKKSKSSWCSIPPVCSDLLKWFFGTIVLGGLGIYTNIMIRETELKAQRITKDTELELQRMEIDSKLVSAVSLKFDTDKAVQLNYLNFIEPFITTDSIKVAVRRQIQALGNSIEAKVSDSLISIHSSTVSKAKNRFSETEKNELEAQALKVPNAELPIASYKKEVDNTLKDKKTILIDSLITMDIQQTKILSTPRIEYDYILQRPPETKWCKEGYYVEFNNSLRIGINQLNRRSIIINLKRLEGTQPGGLIKDNVSLSNGEFFQIDDNDYKYKISLDYIGAAGKNPFTLAAYITVASYKK